MSELVEEALAYYESNPEPIITETAEPEPIKEIPNEESKEELKDKEEAKAQDDAVAAEGQ